MSAWTGATILTPPDFSEVDQDHWLSKLRLPVVKDQYSKWSYHVALVVNPEPSYGEVALDVTREEGQMLLSYLEYRLQEYYPHYRQKMIKNYPYDIDGGVNTYWIRKAEKSGWQYTVHTWDHRSWVPKVDPTYTLVSLLDRIRR